jgi:hypothetical protein
MKIITASTGARNKIKFSEMNDRIFYIAKCEIEKYRELGVKNIIEAPDGLCRAQMRKYIVENEKEPFIYIDDDIKNFYLYRYDSELKKSVYKIITVKEAADYMCKKIIEYNLTDKAIIDFGNNYANFNCKKDYFYECANVFKAFYINPIILKKLNINFPNYESQDDLEMCLKLWKHGKNIPIKYNLLKPNLIYTSDKNSVTWFNNKRTEKVCDSYLRWGNIIELTPFKNGYEKGLRAGVTATKLKKYFNKKNGFFWGNKNKYDLKLKELIEKKDYDAVYNYIISNKRKIKNV